MKLIFGNILCGIGYLILLYYTFFNVKRKKILILNIFINILFGIGFYLLGAISGSISNLFGILMYILYNYKNKNRFFTLPIIPILFIIGYIIINILTWSGPITLLSLFATTICAIAMWMNKEFYIKLLNIPISILWIIYNILYLSYTGLIGQSLLLIMDFVYIYMYFTKYRYEKKTH